MTRKPLPMLLLLLAGVPGAASLSATLGEPGPPKRTRMRVATPVRGELGIRIEDTAGSRGVRVATVSPGGPAADAGLQIGDVLVAVDGHAVGTGRDVRDVMRGVEPGRKVRLDLRRDGRAETLFVIPRAVAPDAMYFDERLPAPGALGALPPLLPLAAAAGWFAAGLAELQFVTLTPKLGRYFGADAGVLVVQAPDGNPLGLEDGDVVQSIDGRVPSDGSHALRILMSYQPGERFVLQVLRQRQVRRIEASLPDEDSPEARDRGTRRVPPPAGD